ncbi:MAG: beta-L-arabinofuranosidase domain-containing protein [Rubripirellula sp.]
MNNADKIHRCTANWTLKDDLPNWHNVNIAECFREPATYYLQTHDSNDLQAAYANFHEIRKRFGQVPGGMFGGDENCRVGFDDPRQATETCGFVEQMLSDEILLQITGDPFWADHCETVAFNSYPAAVMPDFRSLRYLTAPNMVLSDAANHAPGIDNSGPFLVMNPFSSRCCQHNHSHGWPYYAKHLWMATPDNGICAAMYSECEVNAMVGKGTNVRIVESTKYPFDENVKLTIHIDQPDSFPIYMRVPAWCEDARLLINGDDQSIEAASGKYIRIDRTWEDGDTVSLTLPMEMSLQTWTKNHDSVSVNHGPLTFSLKVGERYDRKSSVDTAIGDSNWQPGVDQDQWPSFEIHPTTDWNYGLVLDEHQPAIDFEVQRHEWPVDDFPFTTESVPITITATARKIPQWTLDRNGLCAVLQDSPVNSDQPNQRVTLIPMGAARLRISAFPVIASGEDGNRWTTPPKPRPSEFRITASHTNAGDSLAAIDDTLEPRNSGDHDIPRMTWWDHKGTTEWVQYEFAEQKIVSDVAVYWFDDTGRGECRIPQSWKVLYRDGDQWKPVSGSPTVSAVKKDRWDKRSFDPVTTTAMRIEVQLRPDVSGGILEWKIGSQAVQ